VPVVQPASDEWVFTGRYNQFGSFPGPMTGPQWRAYHQGGSWGTIPAGAPRAFTTVYVGYPTYDSENLNNWTIPYSMYDTANADLVVLQGYGTNLYRRYQVFPPEYNGNVLLNPNPPLWP